LLRTGARIERYNLYKIAHFAKIQNEALPPVRILLARMHNPGTTVSLRLPPFDRRPIWGRLSKWGR
jgi:hypothetical protein